MKAKPAAHRDRRYQVLYGAEAENFHTRAEAMRRISDLYEEGVTDAELWDTRDNPLTHALGIALRF